MFLTIFLSLCVSTMLCCLFLSARKIKLTFVSIPVSILSGILLFFIATSNKTKDYEYWTGFCERAEWRYSWTETVVTTTTDSKGNITTSTHYVYHPDEYYFIDKSNNTTREVNNGAYAYALLKFKNKEKSIWLGGGGGEYVTWNGDLNNYIIMNHQHSFNNPLKGSHNVWTRNKVTKEEAAQHELYNWPDKEDIFKAKCVFDHKYDWFQDERELELFNARFGKKYQIRVHYLIFYDKDISTGILQENYWQNGKKNELNICIGIDKNSKIQWSWVFSWTEREEIKSNIQNFLQEDTQFKPKELTNYITNEVIPIWKRKEFKDFSGIPIDVPTWSYIVNVILSIAITIGIFLLETKQLK